MGVRNTILNLKLESKRLTNKLMKLRKEEKLIKDVFSDISFKHQQYISESDIENAMCIYPELVEAMLKTKRVFWKEQDEVGEQIKVLGKAILLLRGNKWQI